MPPKAKYTKEQIKSASKVIKAAFSVRRKTLVNGLISLPGFGKEEIISTVEAVFGNATVRGETLSAAQFVTLSEKLDELKK